MYIDFPTLTRFLHQADWRRRQQEFLSWLPRGLLIALGIALGLAVLSRTQPFLTRTEIALLVAALVFLALAILAVIAVARRRSLLDKARFADHQFKLRERASTAVEVHFTRVTTSPALAAKQLQDTLAITGDIDITRRMPLVIRRWEWLPVLFALALLAYLLWQPNMQELQLLEQRAVAASVAEQTAALEALAESIAENQNLTAEQQAALQQPVEDALNTLSGQNLSREEAVATLSEAEGQLRDLATQFEDQALGEALNRPAAALSQSEAGASLGQSLQNNQLDAAGQAAAELAADLANFDHGSQQELAQSLAEAAANLQATDSELAAQFQAAADALAEGDVATAGEALGEIASALQEAAQAQTAAAQASQAADTLSGARQEVAQAGQLSEPGAGETGSAGESASGQVGTGNGGDGQSNAQANDQGQGAGEGQQPGAGGPSQGGGHTENVYVPPSVDLSGITGANIELPVQCLGDPDACGPPGEPLPANPDDPNRTGGSIVPYERVFAAYRQTANEALRRGNIPLGLQGLVRDYFSSLEP